MSPQSTTAAIAAAMAAIAAAMAPMAAAMVAIAGATTAAVIAAGTARVDFTVAAIMGTDFKAAADGGARPIGWRADRALLPRDRLMNLRGLRVGVASTAAP